MKHRRKFILFLSLLAILSVLFTACGNSGSGANVGDSNGNVGNSNGNVGSVAASSADAVSVPPAVTVGAASYGRNTITVNSSETVRIVPDIAEAVYAVRTEAKDASACQQKNTEDVSHVIELLKSLGVEETSIQTSDYYMYPIYNYSGNTQRITGYEASTSLTVSNLPIDNLGNILAKSVEAGINNIQSITYQSSRYDEGYSNALKLAMESAKVKAEALAEAGGCSLGNVVGVCENSNYGKARYTDNALSAKTRNAAKMNLEDAAGEFSSIMPGEVEAEVNITVEYLIQ